MTMHASRRTFLKTTAAASAMLAIGFDAKGVLAKASPAGGNLSPFVTIYQDGTVAAIIKHFEGGQGAATGLSALIAEELNMRLQDITFEMAPSDPTRYNNLAFGPFQATGGSSAIANSFVQYRTAGAAVREMLIEAAAQQWGVAAGELVLKDGMISGGGKSGNIGEFVAAAAKLPVPAEPKLKDPSAWTVIGNPQKARKDTSDKINGQGKYAMDVHLDNMMVVAIKRTPRYGGVVASFDDNAAKEVPGFITAAALPNQAGVVAYADNTWAAFQARDALSIEWDFSNAESRSSEEIKSELMAAVNADPEFQATPTELAVASAAIEAADQIVEHAFYFPMLAHAPMEPLNATIEPLEDGGVIMHDGAQGPTANHKVMHEILGIPMEKIQVNTLYAGGFFGRRSTPASDYLVELTLAFSMTDRDRPVKLVWSREDDITGGYYRPAITHKVRVGLDPSGSIVGWDHRIACQSIFKGTFFEEFVVHEGVDHASVEGTSDTPYAIPTLHVGLTDARPATTVNWWRSVGHS
ncbi:MAG: molybdopterin cofactor-binding domain-containing protein, partial [Geminicoccaceae bacterium]